MKTIDVSGIMNCARCGGNHPEKLQFKEFTNPTMLRDEDGDGPYTHWSICPNTGEPILLCVTTESK
jgi:hypothetical protein